MAAGTEFPLARFHFKVEIGGTEISFQEVTGLNQEADHLEYRHGNSPKFVTMKRVGMVKASAITMKRGVFKSKKDLADIFKKILNKDFYSQGTPVDITVQLLDEKAKAIVKWKIVKAVPTKYNSTDLKSDANEIAIESIEFQHEGVEVEFL